MVDRIAAGWRLLFTGRPVMHHNNRLSRNRPRLWQPGCEACGKVARERLCGGCHERQAAKVRQRDVLLYLLAITWAVMLAWFILTAGR
jgi:hypothetical protein